jgi:hypothetical protein
MAVQVLPSPAYPVLQAQVFVPGPVLVQLAWASQPPLLIRHESIGEHTTPLPVYPVLQAQLGVPPSAEQAAVAAHPPLFVAQAPTPVQVVPLPE